MVYAGAPNDLIPGVCFWFNGIANLSLEAAAKRDRNSSSTEIVR